MEEQSRQEESAGLHVARLFFQNEVGWERGAGDVMIR